MAVYVQRWSQQNVCAIFQNLVTNGFAHVLYQFLIPVEAISVPIGKCVQ